MKHAALSVVAMLATAAAVASAQQPTDTTHRHAAAAAHTRRTGAARAPETPEQLRSQAKISEDSARTIALARVKNGSVKSSELERERGRLIYSFDITTPSRSGVTEVNVNALNGKVVAVVHESAKTEAKEAKAEAREKTAPAKAPARP